MLNDNLIWDYENLIKIPQNKNTFFNISLSKDYKEGIEITIKQGEEIDLLNLYLIVKSFVLNLRYLPKQVLITIKNTNEPAFITFNKDVSFFKEITFNKFTKWFLDQLKRDEFYLSPFGVYSYTVIFATSENISYIKPEYPWKNQILNFFWKNIKEEISTEKIIEEKDKIIEELLQRIKELERKR